PSVRRSPKPETSEFDRPDLKPLRKHSERTRFDCRSMSQSRPELPIESTLKSLLVVEFERPRRWSEVPRRRRLRQTVSEQQSATGLCCAASIELAGETIWASPNCAFRQPIVTMRVFDTLRTLTHQF